MLETGHGAANTKEIQNSKATHCLKQAKSGRERALTRHFFEQVIQNIVVYTRRVGPVA